LADYDRLHFTPKEIQLKYFPPLLQLAKRFQLPLFLHSRHPEAHIDFVRILKEAGWDETWPGGVVHSFTGTQQEAEGEGGSKRIISIGEIGLGESEHFGRFCVQRASESPCHVVIELS